MPLQNASGLRVIKDIVTARSATDLARYFNFPVPTQAGDRLHVFATAQELAAGYAQLAAAKAKAGNTAFHPRIVAVELPRNNRFRVWVDWHYTDQNGNICLGEQAIYFCGMRHGQTAVEMIQCLPDANRQPFRPGQTCAQA